MLFGKFAVNKCNSLSHFVLNYISSGKVLHLTFHMEEYYVCKMTIIKFVQGLTQTNVPVDIENI